MKTCDQCDAMLVNGFFCHEVGCPNSAKRYDVESDTWEDVEEDESGTEIEEGGRNDDDRTDGRTDARG